MNLSLYTVTAFLIIDTDGHRVLAKYYHPKSHPQGEPQKLRTLKEQRAFEKGLWQKTKKAGGMSIAVDSFETVNSRYLTPDCDLMMPILRRHHSIRLPSGSLQALA